MEERLKEELEKLYEKYGYMGYRPVFGKAPEEGEPWKVLPKLKLEDNPNFIIINKELTEEEKAENKEVWGEDNITLI